jgi:hypothetical protein
MPRNRVRPHYALGATDAVLCQTIFAVLAGADLAAERTAARLRLCALLLIGVVLVGPSAFRRAPSTEIYRLNLGAGGGYRVANDAVGRHPAVGSLPF